MFSNTFIIFLITISILLVLILNLGVPISIYSIILATSPGYIIKFFEKTIRIEILKPVEVIVTTQT